MKNPNILNIQVSKLSKQSQGKLPFVIGSSGVTAKTEENDSWNQCSITIIQGDFFLLPAP